ncbi:MAG: hypothetical protein GX792_02555 [Bacteroidales bacterium]|jgi:hypothetical protein|nr:carbohydrate-binding family 9-like protein [Mariniphaga sp.]NLB92284.1 hypothetical protein [Bacteroidales bacterium]
MNHLFVKKINAKKSVSFAEAESLLEKQTITNPVQVLNWEEFSYQPKVYFRIGHISNEIWLKYYVEEKHIRAVETRTNGEVYKDSCVEFFISPDGENYYNFEFSCIGTIHLAFGSGRGNRKFVEPATVEKIEIKSTLGNKPFEAKSGHYEWEMMIRIPIESFAYSNLESFNELKAAANFYKCGDETAVPHFVTWNPVKTESPDYHRPEFFGKVSFE